MTLEEAYRIKKTMTHEQTVAMSTIAQHIGLRFMVKAYLFGVECGETGKRISDEMLFKMLDGPEGFL